MIFLKKHMEIWSFLKMFWKDGLFKKIALEYDLSWIIWKDGISSPWKHDIFSFDENWKMIFLKKCMKIWYFLYIRIDVTNMTLCWSLSRNTWNMKFSVYTCRCYKQDIVPLCQKKSKSILSRKKIHLKVIDILGWHSRKSSNNSFYLYGDLYRPFHILFFSKKTQETYYIGLRFDLFFNLFG